MIRKREVTISSDLCWSSLREPTRVVQWGKGIGLMGELKYQLSVKTSMRAVKRWSRSNMIPFMHPEIIM